MTNLDSADSALLAYLQDDQPAALLVCRCMPIEGLDAIAHELGAIPVRSESRTLNALVLGDSAEAASVKAATIASQMTVDGGRVAVCELSCWEADPAASYRRALEVEDVLSHSSHVERVGFLRPQTEVVSALPARLGKQRSSSSTDSLEPNLPRRAAEQVASERLKADDLEGVGFALFEVDETPQQRRRWLAGLVAASRDSRPHRASVSKALDILESEAPLSEVACTTYDLFLALRREPCGPPGLLAELCIKALHNLAWWSEPTLMDPFDRDTGWAIAPLALHDGYQATVRQAMRNALFPISSGLWS